MLGDAVPFEDAVPARNRRIRSKSLSPSDVTVPLEVAIIATTRRARSMTDVAVSVPNRRICPIRRPARYRRTRW